MPGVYYDQYSVEINADPYPVYRRLRDEAPIYYNETHDFFAVSRFEDVEKGLLDAQTYISGRGAILEVIKADIAMPPGVIIFEDPPTHTIHRRLLSRAFTPRRVAELEPKIREFCARSLDPLVGTDRFDFIADLGSQMPMRVIGMLLGIPESDQEAVRDHVDANLRTNEGEPMKVTEGFVTGAMFADYVDWRAEHPSDDIMTELLHVEFADETGNVRNLTRSELLTYLEVLAGAGNETTTRLIGWTAKVLADHPDQRGRARCGSLPGCESHRGDPAVRVARSARREVHRPRGPRRARRVSPGGERDALPPRLGEPGRSSLSGWRLVRHPSKRRPAPHVRQRDTPLHGVCPGADGGLYRPRGGARTLSRVGDRHRACPAVTDVDRSRLGDPAGLRGIAPVTMPAPPLPTPRQYQSPLRRQRAVETRERIIAAGCRLLQGSSVRDWHALTMRSAADEAGVNERTVYRYFGNERGLRDAVMHRLEQEAGVELDGMRLEDLAQVAARILSHVSSYPLRPKPRLDPTLSDANLRQRTALLGALEEPTVRWPEEDRIAAAALFDVLWSVATYERLVSDWDLDRVQAIRTVTWAIGLIQEAVSRGHRPA